jgi:hypothetical protein
MTAKRGVAGGLVGAAAVAAYAWWATGLRTFTWPALVATLAAGLLAMAAGARWLPRRPARRAAPAPDRWRRGVAGWAALAAAVSGWELAAYLQAPREEHPTLSWLVDGLLETHLAQAVAFVGWLVAAAVLSRR